METFYHCLNKNGETVFSSLPPELNVLIQSVKKKPRPIEVFFVGKKRQARFGFKTNMHRTLCICSFEKKYLNSFKKFKELLSLGMISIDSIIDYKKEITTNQNSLTQELIHNLTSLNTNNIQDLFALIPQRVLTENVNNQNEVIKELVIKRPGASL